MRVTPPEEGVSLGSQLSEEEIGQIERLWQQRTSSAAGNDYPIGPGDVLTISVPDVEEIKQRKVRVSVQGTIELPLIGFVQASGITENALSQEIDNQLADFMYKPQASVFVDEYRNREATVVGEVNKPGMVLLDTPAETIFDVLTQAGGVNSNAGDEVLVIPAEPRRARSARPAAESSPLSRDGRVEPAASTQLSIADDMAPIGRRAPYGSGTMNPRLEAERDAAANALGGTHGSLAVRIPLRGNSLADTRHYLSLPVRPGDVVVVPGGGQVMVVGWVQTPGHFSVGSGLTALGAIGAAGGPMYAADTQEVALIRSKEGGSKETFVLDFDKISRGEEADITVKANDVIDVPYSGWRIGPYVFYSLLTRVGIGAPGIP